MMSFRVFEQMSRPIAVELAGRWGIHPDTVKGVRFSANFAYRGTLDGTTRFLRISHSDHRHTDRIAGELAFVDHVADGGFPAARCLPSTEGRRIESTAARSGEFHAVLFEELGDRARRLGRPRRRVGSLDGRVARPLRHVRARARGSSDTPGRTTWPTSIGGSGPRTNPGRGGRSTS